MDGKEGRAWESESRHISSSLFLVTICQSHILCVCVPLWMTSAKCPCLSIPRKKGQHNQGP